jgi:hypothetical protein
MSSSLPTLTRTWQFSPNNAMFDTGNTAQNYRTLLLNIKDALKAFGSNPWTVRGSSDGTAFGVDAVDRWVTHSNLVNGAWIILRQAGIAAAYEVVIQVTSTTANTIGVYVSPNTAYSGGGATTKPTATGEFSIHTANQWVSGSFPFKWHAMQSTDGQGTRVIICGASLVQSFWMFDKATNAHASWTNPCVQYVNARDSETHANEYEYMFYRAGQSPPQIKTGILTAAAFTCEAVRNRPVGQIMNFPDDINGAWLIAPIGVTALSQSARARVGRLVDVYFGSSGVSNGDTFPASGTKLMVQFGHMVFPWDGLTVPQTA